MVSTINCQRPWGSPLDSMEEIISSQCPLIRHSKSNSSDLPLSNRQGRIRFVDRTPQLLFAYGIFSTHIYCATYNVFGILEMWGGNYLYVVTVHKPRSRDFHIILFRCKYEPRCEKTGLRDFRPGPTLTRLYSYRRWLESWDFGFR